MQQDGALDEISESDSRLVQTYRNENGDAIGHKFRHVTKADVVKRM
jgi:hypothetical protein